jgi:hypothetical protein
MPAEFYHNEHLEGRIAAFAISACCDENELPPELWESFRGFFALHLPNAIVIAGISRHEANGKTWLQPPMSHYRLSDGTTRWLPSVAFASWSDGSKFVREASAAIADLLADAPSR